MVRYLSYAFLVFAVLGVGVLLFVPWVDDRGHAYRTTRCRSLMRVWSTLVNDIRRERGNVPVTMADLVREYERGYCVDSSNDWLNAEEKRGLDPWGTPFSFTRIATDGSAICEIRSYGPDRRPDNADDLVVSFPFESVKNQ